MRIEKLNNDKIKVTLTASDLINLNIDVKQLEPDSQELHTFLFHIMETIR
ncbi:MAG: adaptor protein MecA, partial [Hominilimicola sp.]